MWQKHITSFATATLFIAMLMTFWLFPSFGFIIFIALLWNLLLTEPTKKLSERTGMSHGLASAITLGGFIIFVGVFIVMLSKNLIPSFQRFIDDLPSLVARIQQIPLIAKSDIFMREINALWSDLASVGVDLIRSSLTILLSLFTKFIDFVIIIFVTFYLLKDGEDIKHFTAKLFPARDYERLIKLFNSILASLRVYISSQLIVCFITATIVFIYFEARQLPYSSVFAVLSGLGEFIPVLGPTIASIFGILLTATISPLLTVQTLFFYIVVTQLNHNIIYPHIVGKGLNLHPLAIILGVILGGELLGAPGMFLSIPCMAIARYIIIDIYNDFNRKNEADTQGE